MLKQQENQSFVTRKPQQLSIVQTQRLSTAQAEQLGRVQLALAIPRNWDEVRGLLLNDCKDPGFASEAIFVRPGDPPVKGLSIRFAERARQHMRNIEESTTPEFNDERESSYTLTVTDLETNSKISETFTVSKVTNKHQNNVSDDDVILEEKTTQRGQVFVVEATEEEVAARRGVIRSKVRRQLLLGLLPAEIRNQCLEQCIETMSSTVKTDPNAAKNILQEFLTLGIDAADLKEYLGRPLSGATEDDLVELRTVLAAVRQGEVRWDQAVASKKQVKLKVSAAEAFAEQRKREKEREKAKRGNGGPVDPPGGAATSGDGQTTAPPVRRGRRPKNQAPVTGNETSTEGASQSVASPATTEQPPEPRINRRAQDDDGDDEEEDDDLDLEGSSPDKTPE